MMIDHLCRNRQCVNPNHLEVVTCAINARRGHQTRLTPKMISEIRKMLRDGATQQSIADLYGVHPAHISKINSGKKWAQDRPRKSENVKPYSSIATIYDRRESSREGNEK